MKILALLPLFLLSKVSMACDGSSMTALSNTDNGNGTWTVVVRVCAATTAGNGSTTGFTVSTGNTITAAGPNSITGNAGNSKSRSISGGNVTYGDPTGGSNLTTCCSCDGAAPDCWDISITVSSNPSGQTWTVTGLEGSNGSPCTGESAVIPSPTLAVKSSGVRANKNKNGKVILVWTTSFEENSQHFVIERSEDGISYQEIGIKESVGNSKKTTEYIFIDELPKYGNNYYRVKEVDKDGKTEYLKNTVKICNDSKILVANIYPNPISNIMAVQLYSPKADNYAIYITDISGKILLINEVFLQEGANSLSLNTESLSKGLYIVKIQGNSISDIVLQKIVKE